MEVKVIEFRRIGLNPIFSVSPASISYAQITVFRHIRSLLRILPSYLKITAITHLDKNEPISDNFRWLIYQNETDFSSNV